MRIRTAVSGLLVGLGGFGLAAALASASPGSAQYDTVTVTTGDGAVAGTVGAQNAVATTGNSGSTLPFTGMSLVWIVVAGVMLVLLGLALRRRGRRSGS